MVNENIVMQICNGPRVYQVGWKVVINDYPERHSLIISCTVYSEGLDVMCMQKVL